MSQKIRIKLKSYDHTPARQVGREDRQDRQGLWCCSQRTNSPAHAQAYLHGEPLDLVNKKSREQFELSSYKRLIDIYNSTAETIDALMKLELPSGVEVEIKV